MAAPIAGNVRLPLDTGNTGKYKRTQTRVVGADTVHEDFVVLSSQRNYLGVYGAPSGNLTVQATAHNGTTTGFLWLFNPIGSTVKMAVSRLCYMHQITANTAFASAPRIGASLFTFTGTASGATITPAKFQSAYPAPQGSLRTASTGLTVTLGAGLPGNTMPIVTAGTAGWTFTPTVVEDHISENELSDVVLLAGEGMVIWQQDAGTAADTRKLVVELAWSEFE